MVKAACENPIESSFGLKVTVGVICAADLIETLEHALDWWSSGKDSKHNAIFVIPPATAEGVVASVGEAKPEYESVAYHGNVIFWQASIQTFSEPAQCLAFEGFLSEFFGMKGSADGAYAKKIC